MLILCFFIFKIEILLIIPYKLKVKNVNMVLEGLFIVDSNINCKNINLVITIE